MISATLDTSVSVRALNFGGLAAVLLAQARAGDLRIDISEPILRETIGVLREKFQRDPYTINDSHQKLTALCNSVSPMETLDVIKKDSDDNRVLECAVGARSDYIVSEDKDLLRLGHYGKARVLNIADFMKIVAEHEQRKS